MKITNMFFGLSLLIASTAQAGSHGVWCTNVFGGVKLADSSWETTDGQSIKSEINIKTVTLAGPTEIKLELKDVDLTWSHRKSIKTEIQSNSTFCGAVQKVKIQYFTANIKFSRKDKKPVIVDDTPQSSPQTISEVVLCQEKTVNSWPCK